MKIQSAKLKKLTRAGNTVVKNLEREIRRDTFLPSEGSGLNSSSSWNKHDMSTRPANHRIIEPRTEQ